MRDGHEIVLCDDLESFVEGCLLLLLKDTFLCKRIGGAARPRAIELYFMIGIMLCHCFKGI